MNAFPWRLGLMAMVVCSATLIAAPGRIQHEFLAIDEGLGNLLHIHEADAKEDWIVPVGHPMPRDLQLVGGGRVLIGHDAGYTEFDLATGKVVKDEARYKGVTSVRRQPNGDTLIAGVGLVGAKGIVLLEVDGSGEERRRHVLPGGYLRLVRATADETLLLVTDSSIREISNTGAVLHEWTVPGFRHAWKAVRLPGGHTLASAGFGAFMAELDGSGAVTRSFGGKSETPAVVNPNFYATFQLLPNGHVVVANWQGHGPGHGQSGVQLLEFDRAGAVVWQWSPAERISSLQGVLVMDGLDAGLLHDERSGVMAPLGERGK